MESAQQVKLELFLPDAVYVDLCKITAHLQLADAAATALLAVTQWISARKADLDDRDPAERYFVNEALEELFARQKKS
jgi:hypothetical protein